MLQFFGVDDCAFPTERNSATGVAGATATRHDGQTQIDAGFDQFGHFGFGIGRQHHKRVFNPPIGGVGDMRHTAHGIKADVVVRGVFAQGFFGFDSQAPCFVKTLGKVFDGLSCGVKQLNHHGIAFALMHGIAALVYFAQTVLQSLHQLLAALGVIQ